jgi:ATP-dependent exoDNAse (exonuclease V) beta subunit
MEKKVKILDGVVESINTDNQNDVTLIYTKLTFERFVDKSNKLCRGYKQYSTDLMGSIENTKTELKKWQDKFQYIMVDEAQDTNWIQFELMKLLSGAKGNITFI